MGKRIAVFLINITGNVSETWNNSFQTCFLQKYEFCRHKKGKKTSFEDRSMQNKKSVMSLIKHMPFPRYPPMKLGYLLIYYSLTVVFVCKQVLSINYLQKTKISRAKFSRLSFIINTNLNKQVIAYGWM